MIFVDRLSLKSCLLAFKLMRANDLLGKNPFIQVLDPIPNNFNCWVLRRVLLFCGIEAIEADFLAGHLRNRDGENVWTAAQKVLDKIVFKAADKIIDDTKIFFSMNKEWERNTILLYLSKHLFRDAGYCGHNTVFKILIADALSRDLVNEKHYLVLGMPLHFTPDLFEGIKGPLNLSTYLIKEFNIRNTRLSVLLLIGFVSIRRQVNRVLRFLRPELEFGDVTTPALLAMGKLWEDDISLNRSYRTQPHWLFNNNTPNKFRSLFMTPNKGEEKTQLSVER